MTRRNGIVPELVIENPTAPIFEIDPDIELSVQLAIVEVQLQELKNGRYQLKLRYRVNKFSFKNEQATSEIESALLVQEAAIADMENVVATLKDEIAKHA